jgi:hypothetical protein
METDITLVATHTTTLQKEKPLVAAAVFPFYKTGTGLSSFS